MQSSGRCSEAAETMSGYARVFGLVGIACLLVVTASSAAGTGRPAGSGQAHWVITDLGTLGGSSSSPYAMNDEGQVVGTSGTGRGERDVFLWQNGKMVDIGRYGWDTGDVGSILINNRGQVLWEERGRGPGSVMWEHGVTRVLPLEASAINDRGEIVGIPTGTGLRAALWQGGRLRDLGVLPGASDSEALAINNAGAVVGMSGDRAFIWENGTMRDLGVLSGGFSWCQARAINNRGQIIGFCTKDENMPSGTRTLGAHAFLWEHNRMRDLGALPHFDASDAIAINEHGQIIGRSYTFSRAVTSGHAFLWRNGTMIDLGTLGGDESSAAAINDRGQIVGNAITGARDKDGQRIGHAYLWQNGTMRDLGALSGSSGAFAINNHSRVVGLSDTKNGETHAVTWTLRRDR